MMTMKRPNTSAPYHHCVNATWTCFVIITSWEIARYNQIVLETISPVILEVNYRVRRVGVRIAPQSHVLGVASTFTRNTDGRYVYRHGNMTNVGLRASIDVLLW